MTLTLSEDVERALRSRAAELGKTPDQLAEDAIRRQLQLPASVEPPPRDDWERLLLSIPAQTGVSLTDEQVSREVLYED
jgi:hypothetical protein